MPPDASFYEQLQSHVGGKVRVTHLAPPEIFEELVGEIGILLSAEGRRGWICSLGLVRINLFIGGSIRALDLFESEFELIDAEAEDR
jgi:hypothetical protein